MDAGTIAIYGGYIAVFIATFIFARALLLEQEVREAAENIEDKVDHSKATGLLKITRPFFSQYVVPLVRGNRRLESFRKKYKDKLISSGMANQLTPDEFISYKFFLILFFPIVGGLMKAFELLELSPMLIVGLAVMGFFYPDLWINGRIRTRQTQIRKAMPFIVDLLALSTEAGLDFLGAIGRVVEKASSSPLVDEFEQLMKEIKVGASRVDALRDMAKRINMLEINSFVAVLISADQMGASIGKTLRQQSDQIRSDRFVRAEKAGAAAAPKLMLITVLVIFPAVLLMLASPFGLQFISGNPF